MEYACVLQVSGCARLQRSYTSLRGSETSGLLVMCGHAADPAGAHCLGEGCPATGNGAGAGTGAAGGGTGILDGVVHAIMDWYLRFVGILD